MFAGSAPGGPEVGDYYAGGLEDLGEVVGGGYGYYLGHFGWVVSGCGFSGERVGRWVGAAYDRRSCGLNKNDDV